jgi:hypothetical protein
VLRWRLLGSLERRSVARGPRLIAVGGPTMCSFGSPCGHPQSPRSRQIQHRHLKAKALRSGRLHRRRSSGEGGRHRLRLDLPNPTRRRTRHCCGRSRPLRGDSVAAIVAGNNALRRADLIEVDTTSSAVPNQRLSPSAAAPRRAPGNVASGRSGATSHGIADARSSSASGSSAAAHPNAMETRGALASESGPENGNLDDLTEPHIHRVLMSGPRHPRAQAPIVAPEVGGGSAAR